MADRVGQVFVPLIDDVGGVIRQVERLRVRGDDLIQLQPRGLGVKGILFEDEAC